MWTFENIYVSLLSSSQLDTKMVEAAGDHSSCRKVYGLRHDKSSPMPRAIEPVETKPYYRYLGSLNIALNMPEPEMLGYLDFYSTVLYAKFSV